MYERLKKLAKGVLPQRWLMALEPQLRQVVAAFHRGDQVACPLCGGQFRSFIQLQEAMTPDLLCPRCGSLPRKRLLWRYLDSEMAIEQQSWRVLHFSPSRQLEKRLRALPALTYISTDYENPNADRQYDITNIGEEDGAYDLIICYHVMEHIPDDRQAMRELYRLLRPGGTALIQTPHREAPTYEDPAITAPEDRLKAFGQEDHVRYYGREDLTARLTATGFAVDENRYASGMDAATIERLGLNVEEIIFVCRK